MAVSKVKYNGVMLINLENDTATAADVRTGKTFHLADGTIATGTYSGGGGATPEFPRSITVTFTLDKDYDETPENVAIYYRGFDANNNVVWRTLYVVADNTPRTYTLKMLSGNYPADNFYVEGYDGATKTDITLTGAICPYVMDNGETGSEIFSVVVKSNTVTCTVHYN